MTQHRTFIAVELSDETRRRLADLQEQMRSAGARLRWVRPANLHFTLRFLSEISAAQVARATAATREVAQACAPFLITIAGLGAFPTFERPRVVWVGTTEGAEALEHLAAALARALAREGFPADQRHFRPHLTLGRSRDDRQWGDLVRVLHRFRNVVIGPEHVRALTVMESRLTPDGPIYTPWEQVSLGQGLNS
ncbi:MAG: RNA 2',3'-cyclic phosphodiesterase [Armatimonadota bacterium]|nr:RNA 2',3'-cyclic phosphodiesterase [Armatimonadota bacterium]